MVGIGVQNLHLGQVNGIILKRHLQNTVILGKRKTFTHKTQRRKNQCFSDISTRIAQHKTPLIVGACPKGPALHTNIYHGQAPGTIGSQNSSADFEQSRRATAGGAAPNNNLLAHKNDLEILRSRQ